MAAIFSCHHHFSLLTSPLKPISNRQFPFTRPRGNSPIRLTRPLCCSRAPPPFQSSDSQGSGLLSLKRRAISIALAVGLLTGVPALGWPSYVNANGNTPALPDVSVLISGPPIKDPGTLLRNALPIDNKAIREVQKPLEDITDSLKIAGVRALDSVERNVRQASRALKEGRTMIVSGLAKSKVDHGIELLDQLEAGMGVLQQIVEDRNRDAVAPLQKELLNYVGTVEEDMVDGFPYEVPEEYQNMPLLKGRAAVDMKVRIKDNPNLVDCVFHIVLDGYNAPVTAGNFVDLVQRHFYDGMEIQRADGFVVQTGDPEGPAEGFIDPSTEKTRTIPLEIMVDGEKAPFYGATLEELGLYKAQTKLPFNAFGTMAMARDWHGTFGKGLETESAWLSGGVMRTQAAKETKGGRGRRRGRTGTGGGRALAGFWVIQFLTCEGLEDQGQMCAVNPGPQAIFKDLFPGGNNILVTCSLHTCLLRFPWPFHTMMVIGILLHSTYDTAILAHAYAQYLLQPVKAGDTIFIGQCLFIGSETTSVWLMVTEVKGEEKVCLIKNSATLAGSLFTLHVSQIHIQLSTLTEKDKEVISTWCV